TFFNQSVLHDIWFPMNLAALYSNTSEMPVGTSAESFNDKLSRHRYNRPPFYHQTVLGKLCELY
ncbi:hypothetical protein OFC56_39180, partial [Escherichia coli]|nr:hypothetical protein [Escherichia coli]